MKLTPTQRGALLAEYESGADPLSVLAERWGVSMTTLNNYRRSAGLSGRAVVNRDLVPVELVDASVKILPVYPVRLVSRPGEAEREARFERWRQNDIDETEFGGDDGRS